MHIFIHNIINNTIINCLQAYSCAGLYFTSNYANNINIICNEYESCGYLYTYKYC